MTDPNQHGPAGQHVLLGKLPKKEDPRTLKIVDYLSSALPTPPGSVDNITPVQQKIGGWRMMGNDVLGDCTCAGVGHAMQVWSSLGAVTSFTPTDKQIETLYWETGDPPARHGEPGGPTDDGRDELGVLTYVRKHGLDRHKILGFAEVNTKQVDYVKQTINLFGLSYIGLALPRSAQGKSTWEVVPGPGDEPGSWGGHAVIIPNYDSVGPTCITWGQTLKMTWEFFAKYCDESYAVISKDWIASGKTPGGFDLAALQADLQAITN